MTLWKEHLRYGSALPPGPAGCLAFCPDLWSLVITQGDTTSGSLWDRPEVDRIAPFLV
jgi:hypothetical protein